jgi:hypothetical protein
MIDDRVEAVSRVLISAANNLIRVFCLAWSKSEIFLVVQGKKESSCRHFFERYLYPLFLMITYEI